MARSAAVREFDVAPRDRESYFLAAYELLAEHGPAGPTVAALCDRVGVTKGSFYHHFADMPAFVAAFAARWQAWVEHIIDDYLAEPDVLQRSELIINSHGVLHQGANPAIWAWARTEPAIAAAIEALDARGTALCRSTFGMLTDDPLVVDVITRIVTATLRGMQQRVERIEPDRFVLVVREWSVRMLHLDVEVLPGARTLVRVRGRLPEPIPPVDAGTRAGTTQEASSRFGAAIEAIMGRLTPAAERGREAWFRAAHELLAEQGPDALTVSALCARVGVTKGSFHHHFDTMPLFVAALAEQWETTFGALVDNYATEPDPLRRLELMMQTSFAMPHPTSSAFWAWGRTDPVVAAALRRLEAHVEDQLEQVLTELLGDPVAADLLAEMGMGLAIGLGIAMASEEPGLDAQMFMLIAVEWARRCLGLNAELVTVDGLPFLALHPTV